MSNNMETKKSTNMSDGINKFLDSVIKKRKIFNFAIIALSFITFAVALIGSFDAIALKWAISFSIIPFLGVVILSGFRFYAIKKAQQLTKAELIWHSIILTFGIFVFIFWMWATVVSVMLYDNVAQFYNQYKNANNNFTLVVITRTTNVTISNEINVVLNTSLIGSLWAILVSSCAFLFSQTLYNVFARIPNQI